MGNLTDLQFEERYFSTVWHLYGFKQTLVSLLYPFQHVSTSVTYWSTVQGKQVCQLAVCTFLSVTQLVLSSPLSATLLPSPAGVLILKVRKFLALESASLLSPTVK